MTNDANEKRMRPDGEADIELRDRQKAFVAEYLSNGFNATQAAIAAGYGEASAATRGWELVRNRQVRACIEAHLAAAGATRDRVLNEMADLVFNTSLLPYEPLLREGKSLADLDEAGVDVRRIKKMRVTRRIVGTGSEAHAIEDVVIELHDAAAMVKELAKVLGMHKTPAAPPVSVQVNNQVVLHAGMTEGERNVRLFLAGKHKAAIEGAIEGECTPLLTAEPSTDAI